MIGKSLRFVFLVYTITSLVESTAWMRKTRLMHEDHKEADTSETVWSIIARGLSSKRQNSTAANMQNSSIVPDQSDFTTVPASTSTERIFSTTMMNQVPEKLVSTDSTNKITSEGMLDNPWTDKKDEYYFLPDEEHKSVNFPRKRINERERERNTKPPIVKKNKTPRPESPTERRPALLLRLFPDGTAVLISRFQVQLRVKPKEIVFDNDERSLFDDILPFSPETIWSGGKSFEVTYKRLENVPILEKNKIDTNSDKDFNGTVEDIDIKDHISSTSATDSTETIQMDNMENETTIAGEISDSLRMNTTHEANNSKTTNTPVSLEHNNTDKNTLYSTTDDPFFLSFHGEQMESLQRQYEPLQAETLVSTTTSAEKPTIINTTPPAIVNTLAALQTEPVSIETTTTSVLATATLSATESLKATTIKGVESTEMRNLPECLSFRNQLSLALSTEDNIGNALLRRYLLPVHDCNTSDGDWQFASSPVTTTPTPQTSTISQTSTNIPISTLGNDPMPFKLNEYQQVENQRTESDAVMVTSLPMMILLQPRKDAITDTPAWKEVTVGVVRDSHGKPIKTKRGYNNWTAHMRNMKKKPSSEFWYETSTPENFRRSEIRDQNLPLYLNNYQPTPIQEQHDYHANSYPQNYNLQRNKGLYYNGNTQRIRENVFHHSHQNRNDQQIPRFIETNNVNWSIEPHRNNNRNTHRQTTEQQGPLRHVNHHLQGGNDERNLQRRPIGQESRTQQRFTNQNRWRGLQRW